MSDDLATQVRAMRADGLSSTEISEELGISYDEVRALARAKHTKQAAESAIISCKTSSVPCYSSSETAAQLGITEHDLEALQADGKIVSHLSKLGDEGRRYTAPAIADYRRRAEIRAAS